MGLRAVPGELVAVAMTPGPRWTDVLADLWGRGVAVLPIDTRLTAPEQRRIVERAAPAVLLSEDDEVVFGDAPPVAEWVGAVVASSGTGGTPKLAQLPRRALREALASSDAALGCAPEEPWVACLTPAHIGGLLVYLRGATTDHPVRVHHRFESSELLAEAPAWASVVPTMARRLIDLGAPLTGLSLLVGGGALDPGLRTAAEARGARIVTTYGLTETCGGVAYEDRLLTGSRARLATEATIELQGPTLMEGYRLDPPATARAFTVDGWLRTGDVGEIDGDRIRIFGRVDELIRTGGETVWPAEVEAVLREHDKVADAGVAPRPDPEWGAHVVAWVVPASVEDPPSLEELRNRCRERLASFKAPRELFLVDSLPRTPSGKLRRDALPGSMAPVQNRRPESGRG
jgi:O-succinylbenzoic acid--CoA ligase